MTEQKSKMQRIAMGTFADDDRLDRALREFSAGSIDPTQLCLLGCAPRMENIKANGGPNRQAHVQALLSQSRTIAMLDNGEHLMAAPDPFDGIDFDMERQVQGLLHGLEPMLVDGVLALLVLTRTIPEFATVTRILLRHSSHSVRTREVLDRSR